MIRTLLLLVAAPLLAAALLPAAAHAQAIDMSKGGSIDVTAQDGMEWRQNEMMVIANGQARAVRGGVTVTADRLIARYRRKANTTPPAATQVAAPVAAPAVIGADGAAPAPVPPPNPAANPASDTGSNEIYRLEAEGHVHIFTATDLAVGDKAVYDIDQAVLLMTGSAMTITTPQQVMTARDTMEYWSQKHMAVGRGLAVVVTTDGRRVTGDVLVGFTTPPPPAAGQPGAAVPATAPVTTPPASGKPAPDPLNASGKLQRVEGFGHVEVRTATEIVTGDRGVYVAATGIARLAGSVRITRGKNQLDGDEALVNMRTGISTMVRDPGRRVQGLIVPNDTQPGAKPPPAGGSAPSTPAPRR